MVRGCQAVRFHRGEGNSPGFEWRPRNCGRLGSADLGGPGNSADGHHNESKRVHLITTVAPCVRPDRNALLLARQDLGSFEHVHIAFVIGRHAQKYHGHRYRQGPVVPPRLHGFEH
jgi:hypothetical protein